MIAKLKRRFTLLATISMLILMTVLLLIMNLVNYSSVSSEADTVLDILSRPGAPFIGAMEPPEKPEERMEDFIPRGMSPEIPYESRYFAVTVAPDGKVLEPDFSRIISVDNDSSEEYVRRAVAARSSRGFIGQFRYSKTEENGRTRILFLDCGRKLDAFQTFLRTSVGVGLFGCVLVFIFFLFAAGRIVGPIAESYGKQKRFISDAGHEIRTPLTIINANVDLLECDGEREELDEIRGQVKRLNELTDNLVYLSRMEEEQPLRKTEFSLSELVEKTANSFQPLAAAAGLSFSVRIHTPVTMSGSPDALRRLVTVLLENAVKYAPSGGAVTLGLTAARKAAILTVFNTTAEPVRESDLPHVFDRFYRSDASRNSATGGHGIGLSVAKAVAEAHGGSISASTETGSDFTVTLTLPL